MAEDNANPMNLDLNLGPIDNSSIIEEPSPGSSADFAVDLEAWLDDPIQSVREVVRHRNQRWGSLWMPIPVPVETRNTAMELIGGNAFQTGEGSFGSEERATEVAKICEHGSGNEEDQSVENKKDSEKSNSKEGSFFDCNICLDLAKDPVVTCCGHLFCWPCLYRWLHHHSDAKECPVCKGEVTSKNVIPIYGRGNNNNITREPDADSTLKITPRPQARRIGNWRTAIPIPQEMLRRLGRNTFDLSRIQPRNSDGAPEMINNALLNRILTSRGLRRERNHVLSSSDVIELTENTHTPRISEAGRESQRLSSQLLHRSTSHGAEIVAAERLVESYFHSNPVERNGVDDRDSLSSIAAVIHSESQTVDNAMEIDSRVSLSTSSSRRRNDGWRISDLDSGDSRSPRRRRLG